MSGFFIGLVCIGIIPPWPEIPWWNHSKTEEKTANPPKTHVKTNKKTQTIPYETAGQKGNRREKLEE